MQTHRSNVAVRAQWSFRELLWKNVLGFYVIWMLSKWKCLFRGFNHSIRFWNIWITQRVSSDSDHSHIKILHLAAGIPVKNNEKKSQILSIKSYSDKATRRLKLLWKRQMRASLSLHYCRCLISHRKSHFIWARTNSWPTVIFGHQTVAPQRCRKLEAEVVKLAS